MWVLLGSLSKDKGQAAVTWILKATYITIESVISFIIVYLWVSY